jgi:hypothetical protein
MRTIRPSIVPAALAVLVLSTFIAACGGAASQAPGLDNVGGPVAEQPAGGGDFAGGPAPGATARTGTGSDDGVGAPIDDARIIRTGTISLEVKDVNVAMRTARDGIRAMGGYIGASNTSNQDDQPVATISYRIPVDRWEDALDLLRSLSGQTTKVVSEQTEAVEVTGAVLDLQARITNLRASEASLQAIAAKAVRISDVLEVQNQLTQVRGEIESMSAQLKELEDRAAFATLTANFAVPFVAVEVATKDWDPKEVVDEASASLINVAQGLTSAGIWFVIVWLPILLILGALAMIVGWVVRRSGILRPRGPRDGGPTSSGWAAPGGSPTGATASGPTASGGVDAAAGGGPAAS